MTFPSPLTQEEEKECFRRFCDGDTCARDELIMHNIRLVAHVAKRYASSGEDTQDLLSIGTIGLIKAVSTFRVDFGSRFATYAIRCIDNELLMHFRSKKKTRAEVSLFEPIGTDKEGNQIHLMDVLEQEEYDVCEELEKDRMIVQMMEHLQELLTEREFLIIRKRYGLYGHSEQTQREIAKELGISRSYVSRIEKRALDKLKNFFTK